LLGAIVLSGGFLVVVAVYFAVGGELLYRTRACIITIFVCGRLVSGFTSASISDQGVSLFFFFHFFLGSLMVPLSAL